MVNTELTFLTLNFNTPLGRLFNEFIANTFDGFDHAFTNFLSEFAHMHIDGTVAHNDVCSPYSVSYTHLRAHETG
jgi:hypothetical protein